LHVIVSSPFAARHEPLPTPRDRTRRYFDLNKKRSPTPVRGRFIFVYAVLEVHFDMKLASTKIKLHYFIWPTSSLPSVSATRVWGVAESATVYTLGEPTGSNVPYVLPKGFTRAVTDRLYELFVACVRATCLAHLIFDFVIVMIFCNDAVEKLFVMWA
jgi:hypothetical protein